ncbi:MAG: competence protein CoiA family protein [Promethearchaeota archaeon]
MKSKILKNLLPRIESKSESFAHKIIKNVFYNKILEYNPDIEEASIEKYFKTRRADLYFKFKSGKEVVVEIQNSPITSKEITARTKDYNARGIYVLWIFYGDGKCLGSPKRPRNLKDIKVSPAEMRLHQLYRGRAYYMNIKFEEEEFKTTKPYALHFSFSDKFSPNLYRKRFDSFFIRNASLTYIPNWNLLCTNYGNYKIARFYDRNVKSTLMDIIKGFARRHGVSWDKSFAKLKKTKKFFKLVYGLFGDEYGRIFIIDVLLLLIKKSKLILNEKYLKNYKERLIRKVKTKNSQYLS